jgi:hypothetical protein
MPYIKPLDRAQLAYRSPESAGELNYMITRLIVEYANAIPSYQSINDVLGALEGAKLEFYRRVAIPYENRKRQENGDVY